MKHNEAEFEKSLFVRVRRSSPSILLGRDRKISEMNAWERFSKAAFTELNQHAGALLSFLSERAFD